MDREFIACLGVIWCSITYWLGGQQLPVVHTGYKWIRRYILPAGLGIVLVVLGVVWWKTMIAMIALHGALRLGYQNKWWKYTLTGAAMALPSLLIGFHWTIVLPITYHTAYGLISLRDNKFRWGFVAILMGVGVGIAYLAPLR